LLVRPLPVLVSTHQWFRVCLLTRSVLKTLAFSLFRRVKPSMVHARFASLREPFLTRFLWTSNPVTVFLRFVTFKVVLFPFCLRFNIYRRPRLIFNQSMLIVNERVKILNIYFLEYIHTKTNVALTGNTFNCFICKHISHAGSNILNKTIFITLSTAR